MSLNTLTGLAISAILSAAQPNVIDGTSILFFPSTGSTCINRKTDKIWVQTSGFTIDNNKTLLLKNRKVALVVDTKVYYLNKKTGAAEEKKFTSVSEVSTKKYSRDLLAFDSIVPLIHDLPLASEDWEIDAIEFTPRLIGSPENKTWTKSIEILLDSSKTLSALHPGVAIASEIAGKLIDAEIKREGSEYVDSDPITNITLHFPDEVPANKDCEQNEKAGVVAAIQSPPESETRLSQNVIAVNELSRFPLRVGSSDHIEYPIESKQGGKPETTWQQLANPQFRMRLTAARLNVGNAGQVVASAVVEPSAGKTIKDGEQRELLAKKSVEIANALGQGTSTKEKDKEKAEVVSDFLFQLVAKGKLVKSPDSQNPKLKLEWIKTKTTTANSQTVEIITDDDYLPAISVALQLLRCDKDGIKPDLCLPKEAKTEVQGQPPSSNNSPSKTSEQTLPVKQLETPAGELRAKE